MLQTPSVDLMVVFSANSHTRIIQQSPYLSGITVTPTPIPALPRSTIDHIADLISQQTTDRLLAIVMLLGLIFMIMVGIMLWRALPMLKEGTRARFEMAKALEANTQAMQAVKTELSELRRFIEMQPPYPRPLWQRLIGR